MGFSSFFNHLSHVDLQTMTDFQSADFVESMLMKWLGNFIEYLPNVFIAVVLMCLGIVLSKYVKRFAEHWEPKFLRHFGYLRSFVIWVFLAFFWAVLGLLVLDLLHLTSFISHLLAGAGIIGVVMGFAVKDVASNAFAGMLIRTQKPYKRGDWVNVDGYMGVVEEQGMILTGIRTIEGHQAWVPNVNILSESYVNYSTYGRWRVIVEFGVSYGDDLDFVEACALDEIRKLPMIIEPESADLYFINVGSSTYNFQARFWINFTCREDFLRAQSMAIKKLKARFDKEGICVAYNVTTLDFGVKGGVNLYDHPVPISMSSTKTNS